MRNPTLLFALLLLFLSAGPASPQTPGPRRQINLFATGWLGVTTEQTEDRLPLSPQLGVRIQLSPGRIWVGGEGTLDLVQVDSSDSGEREWVFMKGLSGLLRVNLGTGPSYPYLLGFWGRMQGDGETFSTYGGGVGLFIRELALGRAGQLELRYRGDDRSPSTESGRWELGLGLGILR